MLSYNVWKSILARFSGFFFPFSLSVYSANRLYNNDNDDVDSYVVNCDDSDDVKYIMVGGI
jgi:hypothetical protein